MYCDKWLKHTGLVWSGVWWNWSEITSFNEVMCEKQWPDNKCGGFGDHSKCNKIF